jgi:hypothetical protein
VSEEKDSIHPVVRLLVARMESHPEEFNLHERFDEPSDVANRWGNIIDRLKEWASGEDMAVLRKPFMEAIHRDALDELMNGPERRAEEERIRQEEHKRWATQLAQAQQAQQAQLGGLMGNAASSSAYNSQLQNILPGTIIPIPPMKNQGLVATVKRTLGLK